MLLVTFVSRSWLIGLLSALLQLQLLALASRKFAAVLRSTPLNFEATVEGTC